MLPLMRLAIFGGRALQKVKIYGAGQNAFGELGLGDPGSLQYVQPFTSTLAEDTWASFAYRANQAVAIKNDGTLWTTGENSFGQLAQGDTAHRRAWTKVGAKTDWVMAAPGTEFMAALDRAGDIWTAGRNDIAAQLGDGTTSGQRTAMYNTANTGAPFREAAIRFRYLSVGHRFVLGIDTAGNLWSWGNNGSRQLGRASPSGVANPTQDNYHRVIDVPGPFVKCFAGGYHAAALHASGEVWAWGLYSEGQRGPGVLSQAPAVIGAVGGLPWTDIYMAEYSTFLRRADGKIFACGRNGDGQLGIGTTANTSELTELPGLWRYVNCDQAHTLGIQLDGTLWGWGKNSSYQLGNTGGSKSSPTLISAETKWLSAFAGLYSSIATKIV